MKDEPTIVLVHGLVGSLNYFDPQARITAAEVDTLDLLGYGALRHVPPGRLNLTAQVDHLLAHIEQRGCEKVWLLGHSMGGAVVMLAAHRHPERVAGIINVEGNFTEEDTFWSRRIIRFQPDEWQAKYQSLCGDPTDWLERNDVTPTEQRLAWAEGILANQPASTVFAMAHALVHETRLPEYLDAVREVVQRTPVYLLAGAKSANAWGVPQFVRDAAAADLIQPNAGHLMMLEDPVAFGSLLDGLLADRPVDHGKSAP